jgi:hypothetical protein
VVTLGSAGKHVHTQRTQSGHAVAGTLSQAGSTPQRESRSCADGDRQHANRSRDWLVDHASWVVFLHSPEEQTFSGRTLAVALAWCLIWFMAPALGIGPFLL